ncbi:hypothetical protein IK146_00085 [Candidatus Saccharibacteria bacterium]|nr:hypothetical protein [Candidatus Saccharibacteria bacterium]
MSGKEIKVVLERLKEDEKKGGKKKEKEEVFYAIRFPEVADGDRALACYELAKFAIDNGKNPAYSQSDIGYIRDLFLGTSLKRLNEFWSVPGEDTIYFRFKEPGVSSKSNDVIIVLKIKALENAEFIIKDKD